MCWLSDVHSAAPLVLQLIPTPFPNFVCLSDTFINVSLSQFPYFIILSCVIPVVCLNYMAR